MGQPAMSASLARLRRHFGDELLTRVGNQYMLTPLAAELRERTWMALAGVERVFSAQREFDPASLTREFSLMVSDYGEAVLATAAADRLARRPLGPECGCSVTSCSHWTSPMRGC